MPTGSEWPIGLSLTDEVGFEEGDLMPVVMVETTSSTDDILGEATSSFGARSVLAARRDNG